MVVGGLVGRCRCPLSAVHGHKAIEHIVRATVTMSTLHVLQIASTKLSYADYIFASLSPLRCVRITIILKRAPSRTFYSLYSLQMRVGESQTIDDNRLNA